MNSEYLLSGLVVTVKTNHAALNSHTKETCSDVMYLKSSLLPLQDGMFGTRWVCVLSVSFL